MCWPLRYFVCERHGAMKQVGLGFQWNEEGKDAGGFRGMMCDNGDPILLYCWTYRISLRAISVSAENIQGFPLQRRASLKGSHSSLEVVMGRKQKEINSRSVAEKMLILLQEAHGFKVKKGLGGWHVDVMSAFLCDTWRTRNWSQSVKRWWNPASSHNLKY